MLACLVIAPPQRIHRLELGSVVAVVFDILCLYTPRKAHPHPESVCGGERERVERGGRESARARDRETARAREREREREREKSHICTDTDTDTDTDTHVSRCR